MNTKLDSWIQVIYPMQLIGSKIISSAAFWTHSSFDLFLRVKWLIAYGKIYKIMVSQALSYNPELIDVSVKCNCLLDVPHHLKFKFQF